MDAEIEEKSEEIKAIGEELPIEQNADNSLLLPTSNTITVRFSNKDLYASYHEQFSKFLQRFTDFLLINGENEMKLVKSVSVKDTSVDSAPDDCESSSSSRKRKRKLKETKKTKEDLLIVDMERSNEGTLQKEKEEDEVLIVDTETSNEVVQRKEKKKIKEGRPCIIDLDASNQVTQHKEKKKTKEDKFIMDSDSELSKEVSQQKEKKKAKEEKLFIVDTEPSNEVTESPIYKSRYKVIEESITMDKNKVEDNPAKATCFNCSGNHMIRDCPEPRDFQRIKSARMKIVKSNRYHLEDDNKFSRLKPGVISEKLRNALGLRKYDIPPHIYKMRVMGYPPGWLDEAKVVHSNLALFDCDGKKDSTSKAMKKFTIDPDKIIDYPGFNCQPERGSKDECNYYGVPPYSTALSKENMLDFVNKTLQQQEVIDLEELEEKERSKSPSPSLNDLEAQKKQLLEQLTTNDDSNTSNKSTTIDLNESVDPTQLIDKDKEAKTPSGKVVKTSLTGTPILKSLSPYSRLPDQDNFSKDVTPMINFENLPNSTGKYQQMSTVLTKVRSALKSRFQVA